MTLAMVLGTLGIVIVTVAIGMLIDRKVKLLPAPAELDSEKERERKKRFTHGAGEAPQTALRVREAQIAKLRTSQRCSECRAEMRNDPDETVRYGSGDLLVLHFTCPSCSRTRTLYIDRVS